MKRVLSSEGNVAEGSAGTKRARPEQQADVPPLVLVGGEEARCGFAYDLPLDTRAMMLLEVCPRLEISAVFGLAKEKRELAMARLMKHAGARPSLPSLLSSSPSCCSWLAAMVSFALLPAVPADLSYRDSWLLWSPRTHRLFSADHRRLVLAALSVLTPVLPPELRQMVLTRAFVPNLWFACQGEELELPPRDEEQWDEFRERVLCTWLQLFLCGMQEGRYNEESIGRYSRLARCIFCEHDLPQFLEACNSVRVVLQHVERGEFQLALLNEHVSPVLQFCCEHGSVDLVLRALTNSMPRVRIFGNVQQGIGFVADDPRGFQAVGLVAALLQRAMAAANE